MVTLRPYQDDLTGKARNAFNVLKFLRVLMVLSTGGGKTIIFCFIAARMAAAGKRIWILAHRDELLGQISRSLDSFGVRHGVMRRGSAGNWEDVQVCSVQTLVRRLQSGLAAPDLIICDEAHHAVAGSWNKVLSKYPNVPVLGVTATPCRLDGKGLGDVFQHMVLGPSAKWLTDNGFLAPAVIYAPPLVDMGGAHTRMGDYSKAEAAERADKPQICGEAVGHYMRLAMGKRIIVFCVNLKHVEHIVTEYNNAGIPAASLDGNMSPAERMAVNQSFEASRILILVTCDLVNEGYDVPGCDGVQLLRPTQSLGLYLQQVGRCLRPAEGKSEAIILDHVRNWERHGLPIDDRDWELTTGKATKRKAGVDAIGNKQCLACYNIYPAFMKQCTRCGHVPPIMDRTPETVAGELQKIEAPAPIVDPAEAKRLMDRAHTLKDWHGVARKLGKSHRWAWWKHSTQGLRGYSEQD